MKKTIILIIFVLFTVNLFALSLNPFKKDEPKVEQCEEFTPYYKILLIKTFDSGQRVYFVFVANKKDLIPVAVIDETETKIFNTDHKGKVLDNYNWAGIEEKKQSYLDQNFPGLSSIVTPHK